ncbi:MAG: T9SS type A sorting domain-containing protein [Ignavibacteria bacterium]
MKATILLLLVYSSAVFSQSISPLVGKFEVVVFENGIYRKKNITNPEIFNPDYKTKLQPGSSYQNSLDNNSMVRWSFFDPVAIGDRCQTSGNGLYQVVGWGLNTERISLYGNSNSTPLWEFFSNPNVFINEVSISDTAGVIANGSYQNVYLFNRPSNVPFFNFNLTNLPDTGIAGPVAITGNGRFLVACASRNDSSTILGFWRDSTQWVWRYRIGPNPPVGAGIQGIRMSGNDSLIIVNSYGRFYVLRTYTGQLVYQGLINPLSQTSGTQSPQGISGNGNIIATINYYGYVRVFQWSGSTYNLLWQHQEPPGQFYNWMFTVDVTYDGNYVACGTLNFITSSSYDGKVKLFRVPGGSTPLWTYTGFGDNVASVSFSKGGNILTAASWGDLNNVNNDLLVFKTTTGANVPIFQVNGPGSFFWCSTSDDGNTVVGSGKRVHARIFGNGGQLYNIFIDTNDTPVGIHNGLSQVPKDYKLYQNFPNPFNPSTQINYDIQSDGFVRLSVYDILGREVSVLIDKFQKKGRHSVLFNAEELSSDLFFYKLEINGFTESKKMLLIK